MKLLVLELKRVAKTRSTWWLAACALILCVILAFLVIAFTRYYYLDERGEEAYITGFDAIAQRNAMFAPIEGELTPDIIREAFETYHAVYAEYGEDIPLTVEYETLYPINMVLNRVREVFVNEATGVPLEAYEIPPEEAATYYERRSIRLESYMDYLYEESPAAVAYATNMNKAVSTPFVFNYGIGNSDAYEYLTICILLLVLICTVMVAPIFSAEYASGADDILRCTKHGRTRLALTKISAALLLGAGWFLLCIGVFLLIVSAAYGWDSLGASLQLIRSSLCFAPLTAGGFQGMVAAAGLLSFLAIISFTLLLSARLKSPLAVLGIAAAMILLPTIISFGGLGSNIENWVRLLLPSGGVGLRNSMFYELSGFTFLRLGPVCIWSPYVLAAAAALEIPLFCALAVKTYNRHKAA